MIQLNGVTKEYPKRGAALRDLTLSVRKGEFVFLTGHSGSGKSTTLKLIHMAERPTRGEAIVCGFSSAKLSENDVWKVRRKVGYVFQDFRLLPGRTALENVAFALEVTGTRRALDGELDAVVAPYHDVGMAAFKTVAFGGGVNVTLGLPFVRTSPDHGTALELAGTGKADPTNLVAALKLAAELAARDAAE